MKEQLLAAAIAAAVAVPMTATAGDVTVYGTLYVSIDSSDFDSAAVGDWGAGSEAVTADFGYDGLSANTHWSNFGIKGTEDLGNGLSAFFQMEFLIGVTDSRHVDNNRNTFVGLAGDWGKVGIGRNDSPMKKSTGSLELFGNLAGDYQNIGFNDERLSDTVFYYSPNWNGFSFGAAIAMPSVDDTPGDAEDGVEVVSLAATYKNGPWFASLAHESVSDEFAGNISAPEDSLRLGLGWTANGWHVGFMYEDRDDMLGVSGADEDSYMISGSYTFGNNVVKVAYGEEDVDGGDDAELFSIGLDHKLSKRTKVFATYADYDHDGANLDWDNFGVGILHKF